MTPDEFFTQRLQYDRDISRLQQEQAIVAEALRKARLARIQLITNYAKERCYGTD